jgi:hypothetical protein
LDGPIAIVHIKIDDFPSAFLLADKQVKRLNSMPKQIVKHHVQVLKYGRYFYHLSSDLVCDVNDTVF